MIDAEPSPLRILHTDFHRGWGGQINRVFAECRGLAERGHRVILALPGDGAAASRAAGLGIEVFGQVHFRPAKHAAALFADALSLRRLLRDFRPQIVNTHGSQDTWAVALARRFPGGGPPLKHLLTRHNTKRVRNSAINRWLYGRALDGLIVVAPEVLERYRPFIERGLLDEARIPVIPSPLRFDLAEAPPGRRNRIRVEIGAAEGDVVLGTAARLVPDKGQKYLIQAAHELVSTCPALRLVFAGDGPDEALLRAQAAGLGLGKRVHFLGYRADLADFYAALDVAVLPSVDCDASSGMLKEALAQNVPVVATDIGAAREILGQGRFGTIVPHADAKALAAALRHVMADLPAARAAAAQGNRFVRATYTLPRLIDQLEEAYRSFL